MSKGSMTAKDLEDTLAVIATKAKALRDAGVTGPVAIGDISFEIASANVAETEVPATNPIVVEQPLPAIDDADTYGGHIPKRRVRGEPLSSDNDEE